jgi:uncharacterized protein YciI
MATKYVLLYETAADAMDKIPELYPAHSRRIDEFAGRGTLIGIGPFGDPIAQGSMAIFTSREDAQEFVNGDPFVTGGVVARHEIRDWDDALGD